MTVTAVHLLHASVTAAAIGAAVLLSPAAPAFAGPTADPAVVPTAEGSTQNTDGHHQSARRRATFSGAAVTEVKLDDLDANNNKK